jgi:hypothetical protein
MRDQLHLRCTTGALPGCTRPSSWETETDHITEYDNQHPEHGGRTELENPHHLCWLHHGLKSRRILALSPRTTAPGVQVPSLSG